MLYDTSITGKPLPINLAISDQKFLENITAASARFLNTHSSRDSYHVVVEEALKLLNGDFGSVFLYQGRSLKCIYNSSPLLYKISPRRNGLTYKSFIDKQGLMYYVRPKSALARLHIKSVVHIPLTLQDQSSEKATGVINILSKSVLTLTKSELNYLKMYGLLANLTINMVQRYTRLNTEFDKYRLYSSLASHEIKSPLAVVSLMLQAMEKKYGSKDRQLRLSIHKMLAEVYRLSKLATDFLEKRTEALTTPENQIGIHSIREIISRAVYDFNLLYPRHQVQIIEPRNLTDDHISGDFDKLFQVFFNLLINSGKYSRRHLDICITIKKPADQWEISIKDRGIGIAAKHIKHLFDKFYRVSPDSEDGKGLGLYIVDNIIRQHHGSIRVTSRLGVGSVFTVRLPA